MQISHWYWHTTDPLDNIHKIMAKDGRTLTVGNNHSYNNDRNTKFKDSKLLKIEFIKELNEHNPPCFKLYFENEWEIVISVFNDQKYLL